MRVVIIFSIRSRRESEQRYFSNFQTMPLAELHPGALHLELTEFSGTGRRQSADRAGWMWAFVAAGL